MCQIYGIISDACTICDGRGRIGGMGLAVAVFHFVTIIIIVLKCPIQSIVKFNFTLGTPRDYMYPNYPYWSLCPVGRIQISRCDKSIGVVQRSMKCVWLCTRGVYDKQADFQIIF